MLETKTVYTTMLNTHNHIKQLIGNTTAGLLFSSGIEPVAAAPQAQRFSKEQILLMVYP